MLGNWETGEACAICAAAEVERGGELAGVDELDVEESLAGARLALNRGTAELTGTGVSAITPRRAMRAAGEQAAKAAQPASLSTPSGCARTRRRVVAAARMVA